MLCPDLSAGLHPPAKVIYSFTAHCIILHVCMSLCARRCRKGPSPAPSPVSPITVLFRDHTPLGPPSSTPSSVADAALRSEEPVAARAGRTDDEARAARPTALVHLGSHRASCAFAPGSPDALGELCDPANVAGENACAGGCSQHCRARSFRNAKDVVDWLAYLDIFLV